MSEPPPVGDLLDMVGALTACRHPSPVELGERFAWCNRCGAIRVALERPGGEVASEQYFAPTLLRPLAELVSGAVGPALLVSAAATELLDRLFMSGPEPADKCAQLFGSGALLELALANLVDIDEQGAVFARGDMPSGRDSQIRIAVAGKGAPSS